MKFGRTLAQYIVAEWSDHYIAYKSLKRLIKKVALVRFKIHSYKQELHQSINPSAVAGDKPITDEHLEALVQQARDLEQEFFDTIKSELTKVDLFYCKQRDSLERRLSGWKVRITDVVDAKDFDDRQLTLDSLNEIRIQIYLVIRFLEMNKSGFQKILKKFDKKCQLATNGVYVPPMETEITNEGSTMDDDLDFGTTDLRVSSGNVPLNIVTPAESISSHSKASSTASIPKSVIVTRGMKFFESTVVNAIIFKDTKMSVLLNDLQQLIFTISGIDSTNNKRMDPLGIPVSRGLNAVMEEGTGRILNVAIPSTSILDANGIPMDSGNRSSVASELPWHLGAVLDTDSVEELKELLADREKSLKASTYDILASTEAESKTEMGLGTSIKIEVTEKQVGGDVEEPIEARRASILKQFDNELDHLWAKVIFKATQRCAVKCTKYILQTHPTLLLKDNPYSADNRTVVHKIVLNLAAISKDIKKTADSVSDMLTSSKPSAVSITRSYSPLDSAVSSRPYTPDGLHSLDSLQAKFNQGLAFLKFIFNECVDFDAARAVVRNKDVVGRTPLHYAAINNLQSCVEIMLPYVGPVPKIDETHGTEQYGPLDKSLWVDDDGHSPMFYALVNGYESILNLLLSGRYWCIVDRFIDADVFDNMSLPGSRPMSGDATVHVHRRINSVSKLIVETMAGQSPQEIARSGLTNATTKTPLHLACGFGFDNIVKLLLAYGADPSAVNDGGETPLHIAAKLGNSQCIINLTQRIVDPISGGKRPRCDPNTRDKAFGWTPIFMATVENHLDCVELLLAAGADATIVDAMGLNPHEHAVFRAFFDIATILEPIVGKYPENPNKAKISAEGQASFVERAYGHTFLQDESVIRIYLGSLDIREKGTPLTIDENEVPLMSNPGAYKLVVSAANARGRPAIFHLPILENVQDPIDFYCKNFEDVSLTFDVLPAFQMNDDGTDTHRSGAYIPQGVICRASSLLSSAKNSLWQERKPAGGSVKVPFVSAKTLAMVGTVSFDFVVVKPFKHPQNIQTYGKWTQEPNKTKLVGHRGFGMNKTNGVDSAHRLQLGENTLLSFITAGSLGADYVEFDVQVTRDMVPVIYHDFRVWETGYNLPVSNLTLNEFLMLRPRDRPSRKRREDANNRLKGFGAIGVNRNGPVTNKVIAGILRRTQSEDTISRYESRNSSKASKDGTTGNKTAAASTTGNTSMAGQVTQQGSTKTDSVASTSGGTQLSVEAPNREDQSVQLPFTTLEETLREVPQRVGFNVEVKYPMLHEALLEGLEPIEINAFTDKILQTIFEHVGDRKLYFSSFHPEICWMLSMKQSRFPVFFLTDAGCEDTFDERCNSLMSAVRFATRAGCLGIVTQVEPVLRAPRLVRVIRETGLLLFTYGKQNNEPEFCRVQRQYGVDAIIADRVRTVLKELQSP